MQEGSHLLEGREPFATLDAVTFVIFLFFVAAFFVFFVAMPSAPTGGQSRARWRQAG